MDRDGLWLRPFMSALLLAVIAVVAAGDWAVHTPVLGAHLPAPVHISFVVLFFLIVVVALAVVAHACYWWLARRSQARRARQRARQR